MRVMVSPVLISDSPLVCLKHCSARLPRTSWGSRTGPHAAVGGGRAEDETRWQPPPFVPGMFSIGLCRGQRQRDPVEVLFQGRLEPARGQPLALAFRSKDKLKMEGSLPSPSLEPGVSLLIIPRAPRLLGRPRVVVVTATPPCIDHSSPGKQHHLPA